MAGGFDEIGQERQGTWDEEDLMGYTADCDGIRDLGDDIEGFADELDDLEDTVGDYLGEDYTYLGFGPRQPDFYTPSVNTTPSDWGAEVDSSNPRAAIEAFTENWSTTRERLAGDLRTLASFLTGAADAYEDTDCDIAWDVKPRGGFGRELDADGNYVGGPREYGM